MSPFSSTKGLDLVGLFLSSCIIFYFSMFSLSAICTSLLLSSRFEHSSRIFLYRSDILDLLKSISSRNLFLSCYQVVPSFQSIVLAKMSLLLCVFLSFLGRVVIVSVSIACLYLDLCFTSPVWLKSFFSRGEKGAIKKVWLKCLPCFWGNSVFFYVFFFGNSMLISCYV